jgi:hypothetical protein
MPELLGVETSVSSHVGAIIRARSGSVHLRVTYPTILLTTVSPRPRMAQGPNTIAALGFAVAPSGARVAGGADPFRRRAARQRKGKSTPAEGDRI